MRRGHLKIRLLLATVILCFLPVYFHHASKVYENSEASENKQGSLVDGVGFLNSPPPSPWAPSTAFPPPTQRFWANFSKILHEARPRWSPSERIHSAGPQLAKINPTASSSASPLLDEISMPDGDVKSLHDTHATLVKSILSLSLTAGKDLPYLHGTHGIVTVAGDVYFPVLLVSLRLLRSIDSTLPVEFFLQKPGEYEPYVCDTLLPSLNAKCLILSDIIASNPIGIEMQLSRYQLKPFGMLFSSFERILYLDADNIAIMNPDELLTSEPFISHGMVTRPDFWLSSQSPLFSQIANISTSPTFPSTVCDQLLSKPHHLSTLMLSSYYTLHGSAYFFPLLARGAPGKGDKETFAAAAATAVFNLSYHSIQTPVGTLGYAIATDPDTPGPIEDVAMTQAHSLDDYEITTRDRSGGADIKAFEREKNSVRKAFIHHNYPKLDAAALFIPGGPTRYPNGTRHRMWGHADTVNAELGLLRGDEGDGNVDMETRVWDAVKWTASARGGFGVGLGRTKVFVRM